MKVTCSGEALTHSRPEEGMYSANGASSRVSSANSASNESHSPAGKSWLLCAAERGIAASDANVLSDLRFFIPSASDFELWCGPVELAVPGIERAAATACEISQ